MPVKFVLNEPRLETWILCHQTYNLVSKCEEAAFAETGLTPQQHGVLLAIKYIKGPATPTTLAHWLDRKTNSISMIVNRMERAGLVKGARDRQDRRSLRLVTTRKGKGKLEQATKSGWELIERLLSGFSDEELQTFIRLMEKLRGKAFEELTPGKAMDEVQTSSQDFLHFLARLKVNG
jgi:DNA-binding MarR family transcriptional regulator